MIESYLETAQAENSWCNQSWVSFQGRLRGSTFIPTKKQGRLHKAMSSWVRQDIVSSDLYLVSHPQLPMMNHKVQMQRQSSRFALISKISSKRPRLMEPSKDPHLLTLPSRRETNHLSYWYIYTLLSSNFSKSQFTQIELNVYAKLRTRHLNLST